MSKEIIATAPRRIALAGGGTDVDPFNREYNGMVVNLAISPRTRVKIEPSDEEGELTAPYNELIMAILKKYHNPDVIVEVNQEGSGGLGGSASMAVALIAGLRTHLGLTIRPHQLAWEAFEIEVKDLGWHGGWQDQFAAAYGGFNMLEYYREDVVVRPLPKRTLNRILPYMILFDTNIRRKSFDVQDGFKEPSREQIEALMILKGLAADAERHFLHGGKHLPQMIANILRNTWITKKMSNKVTNSQLDEMYEHGLKHGAMGGKLLGAGQGGHILFVAHPDDHLRLKLAMEEMGLTYVEFAPDFQGVNVRQI